MTFRAFNLKGIREGVFDQLDWAPNQGTVAKDRVDLFIDRAIQQMALEAPSLFDETEFRVAIHPDREPTLSTDLLKVASGDAWVLTTEISKATTDALQWETDRLWWGRHLMLKVPSSDPEEWHLIRIREVWEEVDGAGDTYVFVSLEQPWRNTTDTGIEYRVISNEYHLPDDLIEVRSASLFESSVGYPYPMAFIGQTPAEFATMPNQNSLQAEGVPRYLYRRERQQLDGPRRKPGIEIMDSSPAWAGPEATGTFEYLITYVWGKQEVWSHAPGPKQMDETAPLTGRYEPFLESGPSPVSDQATVDSSQAESVRLHLPNYDHMVGFDDATTKRYRKAGIRKRIYRRRVSADAPSAVSPSSLAYPHQDAADRFYLLDEVDGHTTEYVDDGSVIPDLLRPLREVHSYQTFQAYPSPDNRYELVIRAVQRPLALQDDNDVPKVPRDAMEAVIHRVAAMVYEMQGNAAMASKKMGDYERSLTYLLKRYGDMRPAGRVRRRRVAKPRSTVRDRRDVAGVVRNS